jgi:hypothetical protein
MSEDIKVPIQFVTLNGEPVSSLPVSGTIEPLIPWRKPDERPEDGRAIYVRIKNAHPLVGRIEAGGEDYGYEIDDAPNKETCGEWCLWGFSNIAFASDVCCWMYLDELAMPSWVQK